MARWARDNLWIAPFMAALLYYVLYVHSTTVDVVFLSWLEMTDFVGSFIDGTLDWGQLFAPYGEHGMFGYRVLLLLNTALFKLTVWFDAYVIIGTVAATALMVVLSFRKSLPDELSSRNAAILVAPLAFLLFSLTQGVGSGMDTQVKLSVAFGLAAVLLFERTILRGPTPIYKWVLVFGLVVISVLVFGTMYSAAWAFCYLLIIGGEYLRTRRVHRASLALLIIFVLSWFCYYLVFSVGAVLAGRPAVNSSHEFSIFSPWDVVKFLVAAVGSGAFSTRAMGELALPHWATLLNGSAVAVAYLYSLWRFYVSGMYRKSYLPACLIVYSSVVACLVMLGRPNGWGWGMNEWYAVHYKLGVVGVFWILLLEPMKRLSTAATTNLRSAFRMLVRQPVCAASLVAVTYVLVVQVVSNAVHWKAVPHVRAFFATMVPNFCAPEHAIPVRADGLTPFLVDVATTRRALRIMKKHGLNIRCDHLSASPIGSSLGSAALFGGWYGAEALGSRWIARMASAQIRTGARGIIKISAFLPGTLPANRLTLSAGESCTVSRTVEPGEQFSLECSVSRESVIDLTISCEHGIVPADRGINADKRELCVKISTLEAG